MKTILIVEDDLKTRRGLIIIAKKIRSDIQILEASSEEEALGIAKQHEVGAFFLDIQLEKSSGFDLALKLRDINEYKFVPIVFITGLPDSRLDAYVNLNCYDYILKPFNISRLRKIFEEVIYFGISQKNIDKIVKIKERGISYTFFENEIILFEYLNKRLHLTTIDSNYEFTYCSLKKVSELISDQFIQCHKSYIVNQNHIEKVVYRQDYISLRKLDRKIPIGRKFKSVLEEIDDN